MASLELTPEEQELADLKTIANKLGLTFDEQSASIDSLETLIKTSELQESKLNSLNKAQLQKVCTLLSITYTGTETNQELVTLILSAK